MTTPRDSNYEKGQAVAIEELVAEFKTELIGPAQLWIKLDSLINKGSLSETQRRQTFWDAQSVEAKDELANECAYFDPQNDIWSKDASQAQNTDVNLSKYMASMAVAEELDATVPEISSWAKCIGCLVVCVITACTLIEFLPVSTQILIVSKIALVNYVCLRAGSLIIAWLASSYRKAARKCLEQNAELGA